MSIFDLRQSVIDEYSKYVQTFLSIAKMSWVVGFYLCSAFDGN